MTTPGDAKPQAASPIAEAADVFRKKYEDDASDWRKNSGPGSHPYHTIDYVAFLSKFIHLNGVRTVVDIGCGDWQFSRNINFQGARYLGLDIVPSVIERNKALYARPGVDFALMPKTPDGVPAADLLLIKDVLQHLPDATIDVYAKLVFPRFRFCLVTNSFTKLSTPTNVDICSGDFRCLDLTAPSLQSARRLRAGILEWCLGAFAHASHPKRTMTSPIRTVRRRRRSDRLVARP